MKPAVTATSSVVAFPSALSLNMRDVLMTKEQGDTVISLPHAAAGIAERVKFVKCSAMRAIVVAVEPMSIGGMPVMALGGTGVGAA
jgi:hypothetical protein